MFPAVMFLSDNGGGAEVGLFLVHDVGGSVLSQNDAFSITFSDAEYSGDIDDPGNVSWLLYRSTVQSTSELISNLIDTISEINQVAGIGRSFDAKFRSIVQVLDDANANNDGAALNGLYALCSYVEAQRGKKLTNAQADDIVAGADHVISSLNAFAPMCD
jgi:hypothetical protein